MHRTRALDLESLVVKIGEEVWCLKSDIVILNNDGGLYEAANLALIGSLLNTKLPGPRGLRPIVLHHLPIAVTFGFLDFTKSPKFDRSQPYPQPICFTDPTYLETLALDGLLTIYANAQGEICAIHKNGGVSLSAFVFPTQTDSHINTAISYALEIAKDWHISLMKQMGDSAPPSLANVIPLYGKDHEDYQDNADPNDEEAIKEEVLNEFKREAYKESKEEANIEEEDEDVDPTVLALFS